MQPLLLTTEKRAEFGGFTVTQDHINWTRDIIAHFLKNYPFLQNTPLQITWHQIDHQRGFAVGSLHVLNGHIPVIINDFRVSPLDVYLSPEITTPITPEFLYSLLENGEGFQGLSSSAQKATTALFGSEGSRLQFAPNGEMSSASPKLVSRPAVKVASAIEHVISRGISDQQVETLLEKISSYPELVETLNRNNWTDLLQALKEGSISKKANMEGFLRNLEIDRQMLYKDEAGNYRVKQANSGIDYTWDVRVSSTEAAELAPILANSKRLPKIEKRAEVTTNFEDFRPGTSGELVDGAKNYGFVRILDVQPVKTAGLVFQSAVGPVQASEEGWTKTSSVRHDYSAVEGSNPAIGEFGMFVTEKTATAPMEIVGMRKDVSKPGNWMIKGASSLQISSYYPLSVGTEIELKEGEKNAFYIPKTAKWVVIGDNLLKTANFAPIGAEAAFVIEREGKTEVFYAGEELELSENAVLSKNATLQTKTALETYNSEEFVDFDSQNHQVHKDEAGFYRLSGRYFQNLTNLDKTAAVWAVIHRGGTEMDVEKVASLRCGESYCLEGVINPLSSPNSVDKIAEDLISKDLEDRVEIDLDRMLKVAQNFREKASVDAILALGMLRKRNIQEYLLLIPTYETVMSELAKLVVAARLGMTGLSPEPIKEAMEALSEVVLMLKTVQSLVVGSK